MTISNSKHSIYFIVLVTLIFLHGCGERLSADNNNQSINFQPGSDLDKGKQLLITMHKIDGRVHFNISTIVANGCYSKGEVTEARLKNDILALNTVINYKSGICSQALKKISFTGILSVNANKVKEISVNVFDSRSKTNAKKIVSILR